MSTGRRQLFNIEISIAGTMELAKHRGATPEDIVMFRRRRRIVMQNGVENMEHRITDGPERQIIGSLIQIGIRSLWS